MVTLCQFLTDLFNDRIESAKEKLPKLISKGLKVLFYIK